MEKGENENWFRTQQNLFVLIKSFSADKAIYEQHFKQQADCKIAKDSKPNSSIQASDLEKLQCISTILKGLFCYSAVSKKVCVFCSD